LHFAERENQRSLAGGKSNSRATLKKKILFLFVLLCAVAQGARAQWDGGTYTATEDDILGSINVSTATLTIQSGVTVRVYGSIVITGTLTVTGSGTLRVLANEGGEGENGSDSFAVVRCCSAAARSEASTLVTPASESTRMTIPPATASGADWGRKI